MKEVTFDRIWHGGDYNPDQWPEDVWREDMRLFQLAGVNIVTLPVFSWAKLQPEEDRYDFGWLDRSLDLLHANGISVCLATPTAAQPAWMSRKYPDMLPVDEQGRRRTHGKRVNFCPNSPVYRAFSRRIAGEMARRYGKHPALKMWHIANEYGTYCFCPACEKEFRKWLRARYGTVEELNERWGLSFWGHTVYDWEEVVVPSERNDDNKWYQPVMLDYMRFMTDSNIACFRNEYDEIKAVTPDVPVTTNMSGFIKKLDQFRLTANMDVVGWDNYPSPQHDRSLIAFKHDLMRGLKGGQPFLLVEQTPSQQNWQPYNTLKQPGYLRLLSYQALAHGADSVMYFQLRQSASGVEKLHGALISHAGHEHTRVFRECADIGREMKLLGGAFTGGRPRARAALLFDWDNWWAVELSSGPSRDLQYLDVVAKYYKAFYGMNIPVDILPVDGGLNNYDVIVAPLLYMVKPGVAEGIRAFVRNGGAFVASFFSGIVDENDRVKLGGYPGELRDILGVWVEETDALLPGRGNRMAVTAGTGRIRGEYACGLLCDILHLEGAAQVAAYAENFYAGQPCLTVNRFGAGSAWYVGSDAEDRLLSDLMRTLCDEKGISAPLDAPGGVEATRRYKGGYAYTFLLNHTDEDAVVELDGEYDDLLAGRAAEKAYRLPAGGVAVLRSADTSMTKEEHDA